MTKNTVGGVVAVIALGAIFYFGHLTKSDPIPAPVPTQKSEPIPERPVEPAPAAVEPTPVPLPVSKPPVKPNRNPNRVVYHRVEQGGKQGPQTACTSVQPFAEGKSKAELAVLAKQYGVSVAEVQRWFICN